MKLAPGPQQGIHRGQISGQREALPVGRELHGDQRAVQLLLHVRDAAEDSGETA